MDGRWTKRVRLLGEDLVLFRDRSGGFGLIAEACPHRRASLAYGIPTADGIRCPYHGWLFDGGRPLHSNSRTNRRARTSKTRCATAGYPVRELGGVLFAYLGPRAGARSLPRLDGFVTDGDDPAWSARRACRATGCRSWRTRSTRCTPSGCTGTCRVRRRAAGGAQLLAFAPAPQDRVRRVRVRHLQAPAARRAAREDSDDWRIGHPVFFPNILAVGSGGGELWKMSLTRSASRGRRAHAALWYDVFIPPPGADGTAASARQRRGLRRPVRRRAR